jgi:CheY-like chemotaxis protein
MANVLIVDDDVAACRPLERFLEVTGHHAFVVHDGRSALSMLDQLRPDMILLDVMMPGMDGVEVLRRIRKHPAHRNLPVIVYSALSDDDTIAAAMKHGAQDYLVKSRATVDRLQSAIERHLGDA